jgi:hypothetical protein
MMKNTQKKPSVWDRYRQVFMSHPVTAHMNVDALIDAWSDSWFTPDEVSGWLAQGIIFPEDASARRIQKVSGSLPKNKNKTVVALDVDDVDIDMGFPQYFYEEWAQALSSQLDLPTAKLGKSSSATVLEEWERGRDEEVEEQFGVVTHYNPRFRAWYEESRRSLYFGSLWCAPCVFEGYNPKSSIFFSELEWVYSESYKIRVIGGFDEETKRLVMLPGTTVHKLHMHNFKEDKRSIMDIKMKEDERRNAYREKGIVTTTVLSDLVGEPASFDYKICIGGPSL